MVGYKYQRFEYDVSNTNQVSYGIYSALYTGLSRERQWIMK
ncbi:MAG: hypothetical protein AB1502_13815 [Thermodesulfobacteriota bacterium]